ncbi:MAG TPA: hypothetical protein EYP58_03420 [bacterium (Candidatus Stahlbacteria)]|nr:hypothetical protein [Candidatus Stahlbacteria bacterium]
MKILILSDLHGNITILDRLRIQIALENPDLVLFCGDIVKGHARGNEWLAAQKELREARRNLKSIEDEESEDNFYYREFLHFFSAFEFPTCFVPGNMDAPWSRFWNAFSITGHRNIHLVHRTFFFLGRTMVYGFGGEISEKNQEDFFVLIYPRWEVEKAFTKVEAEERIYIFHHPPAGFATGGSEIIRLIIERDKPMLVACGHKHKEAKVEKITESVIINPGPLKEGRFALFDSNSGEGLLKTID